jgi:small conductance mechanosensitive channel
MVTIFAAADTNSAVEQSKEILDKIADTFFNMESLVTFVIAVGLAVLVGRIIAAIMRRFTRAVAARADKTQDLNQVNRLRRIETLTILGTALLRMFVVIIAIYVWWVVAHPGQQPTAIVSATALTVIVAGATIAPILRDLASGSLMMAEHWFGVGDHIRLEPFADLQGVVERVTLRSTKIRGLNGEVIWVANQNIQGVRVAPKGVRTIAIDLFVSDIERGLKLVEETNLRLPSGPLMVVRPLHIMDKNQVGAKLWHIAAVGETAPGREWLLEDYALRIMKELDEEHKTKVLENDPIARYADSVADRRFARTVQNATKSTLQRKQLPSPEDFAKQLLKRSMRHKKSAAKPAPKSAEESTKRPPR